MSRKNTTGRSTEHGDPSAVDREDLLFSKGEASVWDGGWYVFEDGKVVGPLSSVDTFTTQRLKGPEQTGMVSRKGFTQWYPIQSFSEIHTMAGGFANVRAQSDANPSRPLNKFEPVAKFVGPSGVSKLSLAQEELSSGLSLEDEMTAFPKSDKRSQLAQANAQSVNDFNQQYLQVFSRLRLGRITNLILGPLVYVPLTLGGYWWAWMMTASQEVSWHLNASSRMNFVVPMWTCIVPGAHLVVAFLLARMVRQMEQQNGYSTINLVFATVAAIFPPLYMIIIQSALNKHWRLHVLSAAGKT